MWRMRFREKLAPLLSRKPDTTTSLPPSQVTQKVLNRWQSNRRFGRSWLQPRPYCSLAVCPCVQLSLLWATFSLASDPGC